MSFRVTRRTISLLVSAALLAACVAASATASQSKHTGGQLVGAGSTFVQPLVSQWQAAYPSVNGTNIVYQPIGSGGGIQAITQPHRRLRRLRRAPDAGSGHQLQGVRPDPVGARRGLPLTDG